MYLMFVAGKVTKGIAGIYIYIYIISRRGRRKDWRKRGGIGEREGGGWKGSPLPTPLKIVLQVITLPFVLHFSSRCSWWWTLYKWQWWLWVGLGIPLVSFNFSRVSGGRLSGPGRVAQKMAWPPRQQNHHLASSLTNPLVWRNRVHHQNPCKL